MPEARHSNVPRELISHVHEARHVHAPMGTTAAGSSSATPSWISRARFRGASTGRTALRRRARRRSSTARRARVRRERRRGERRWPTSSSTITQRRGFPRAFEGRLLAVPLDHVGLRAPIPRPPSMRDGYAFRQHVQTARKNRGLEMIPEFDQFPVFYFTNHQASSGRATSAFEAPHRKARLRARSRDRRRQRSGNDLTRERRDALIFGMTIMNDWSARALQMEEMKLNLGPAKGKDSRRRSARGSSRSTSSPPYDEEDRARHGVRSRDARAA